MSIQKYQNPELEARVAALELNTVDFTTVNGALAAANASIYINDQAITGAAGYGLTTGAGISGDGDDGLQADGNQLTLAQGVLATAQTFLRRYASNSFTSAYVEEDVFGDYHRTRIHDAVGTLGLTLEVDSARVNLTAVDLMHVEAYSLIVRPTGGSSTFGHTSYPNTVTGSTTSVASMGVVSIDPHGASGLEFHHVPGAGPAVYVEGNTNRLHILAGSGAGQSNMAEYRLLANAQGGNFEWYYNTTRSLTLLVNGLDLVAWDMPTGAYVERRTRQQTGYAARQESRYFYGTTADASLTAISGSFAPTVTGDCVIRVRSEILAIKSDGSVGYAATLVATFRKAGGTVTLLGTANEDDVDESVAGTGAYHDVSVGMIRTVVAGIAAENWRWECYSTVTYGSV